MKMSFGKITRVCEDSKGSGTREKLHKPKGEQAIYILGVHNPRLTDNVFDGRGR